MQFHLTSEFKPTGDQPEAISQLVQGVNEGRASQVLLGHRVGKNIHSCQCHCPSATPDLGAEP